jgi:DNA-binding CsgD family transcriptional regulator
MAMSGKDELTPRERDVLELLVRRLRDQEIAARLVISVRTVEAHVAHILQKFGVHSRDELPTLVKDQ